MGNLGGMRRSAIDCLGADGPTRFQGVLEPDGEVADCLLVNLHGGTGTTGFTAEQGAAIIEVVRFIVQNNGWEPDDPVNVESAVALERTWSRATYPWLPVPPDPPPPR
jgi:hypothetical protein